MTPNQITALRVVLGFAAVALFGRSLLADAGALALVIAAIAFDGLDGWVARRRGLETSLGAQFDILGDRMIENLFFTYFAVCGLVTLWVPVFFFLRGASTDFLRGLAARAGRVGFGSRSMLESWWGRRLVASRSSRVAYAALKCVCFCWLGLERMLGRMPGSPQSLLSAMALAGQVIVGLTVAFCLLRAVPVFWEGRRYLNSQPRVVRSSARVSGIAVR